MLRKARILLASTVLCLVSNRIAAADVVYDFSGKVTFLVTMQNFQYTAPTFITTDVFIPASALDFCTSGPPIQPCFGVNFLPSGPDSAQHYPEITFQTTNPDSSIGTVFYYFPLGSFSDYGTTAAVSFLGNAGTLTTSAVPEPSSGVTALLGALMVVLLALYRSRNGARGTCAS